MCVFQPVYSLLNSIVSKCAGMLRGKRQTFIQIDRMTPSRAQIKPVLFLRTASTLNTPNLQVGNKGKIKIK